MKSKQLEVDEVTAVRQQRWLFEPVSFRLAPGQWIQIQGENGVGKSTFLRILAGLYPHRKGKIRINGQPMAKVANYGQQLFYLGHKNFLSPDLSVAENLQLFISLHHLPKAPSIDSALETLGIKHLKSQVLKFLSFGQQQRVVLSCAILHSAWVWLLDEPLVGLDQYTIQCFTKALKQHLAKGGAAIIATHQTLPGIEPTQKVSFHAFAGEEAW